MDFLLATAAPETARSTLRAILRGLMAAIGLFGLPAEQGVFLHRRIAGIAAQVERLLVRFRAGRLWRVAERKGRVGAIRRRRIETLPKRFGWLVIAGGHRAAGFGCQLEALLREPEMVALLDAAPQARTALRPLCRALAVILPGETPRETAQDSDAPPVRRRRPRPKPEPFRIPLPRGVLTAARRQGFGKLC
jgi:hypothetical protein